jgi:hypothetical protein
MAIPTNEQLNQLILTRLNLIGIDISVLPVSDPSAPADQTRVLAAVRNVLTGTVPVSSGYELDVQKNPPSLYPSPFSQWTAED